LATIKRRLILESDISQKIRDRKTRLQTELDRIVPVLIAQYQPKKILLFGALARAEVSKKSNVLYERTS